ncbi:response regulator [Pseudomonas sp. SO81]|uniref:response regulator n=1 Tax=Pseudomonas sp. SO81 TaxID=2983246 RepID=UPI0025A35389|nr:response regulator [Pseudomonas sp. SO81]WJN61681.1 hypothetical protein OH686_23325 [Pseudomonas sp. SO81]
MSRILIVDSYPILRRAMRLRLEAASHEVLEADNGRDALDSIRQSAPDLVMLDLAISQPGGLELIRRLKGQASSPKILVYSAGDTRHMAVRCMQAGADGFVSKREDPDGMAIAVRALLKGRSYFPGEALAELGPNHRGEQHDELQQLSPREFTVLQQLAAGSSNQAIAERMSLSFKTVSTYKARLMQKLHVGSLVELAEVARRHGLLASDEAGLGFLPAVSAEQFLLQRVLDSMPMRAHVCDRNGRLLFCNQAFCEFTGMDLEQMRGRPVVELGWSAEGVDAEQAQQRYLTAVQRAEPYSGERVLHVDGRRYPTQIWAFPYRDSNGELLGMICCGQDLSRQESKLLELSNAWHHAEAETRSTARVLEHLGGLLRDPLEQLGDRLRRIGADLGAQRHPAMQEAEQILQRMQQLNRQLDELAALELGTLRMDVRGVDLRELVSRVAHRHDAQACDRGIRLCTDLDSVAVERIWIDPDRFAQILDHLIGCALRSADYGSVAITLATTPRPDAQADVHLTVGTTDRQALQPVPEPLEWNPDNIGQGEMGLEWVLSRRLAEQLNGALERRGSAQAGCLFTLSICAAQAR